MLHFYRAEPGQTTTMYLVPNKLQLLIADKYQVLYSNSETHTNIMYLVPVPYTLVICATLHKLYVMLLTVCVRTRACVLVLSTRRHPAQHTQCPFRFFLLLIPVYQVYTYRLYIALRVLYMYIYFEVLGGIIQALWSQNHATEILLYIVMQ